MNNRAARKPGTKQHAPTPRWAWLVVAVSLTTSASIASVIYVASVQPDGAIASSLGRSGQIIANVRHGKVGQAIAELADHGRELLSHTYTHHPFGEPCSAATLALTGPWAPPGEPRYVTKFESGLGEEWERYGGPHERWMQTGEHESNSVLEVQTEFETWCFVNMCRTCLTEITASIGFTPSVIRLHEKLRRNRCQRNFTMHHELGHAEITRKAQAIALQEARQNLMWTQEGYPPIKARENSLHTGASQLSRKVHEDLAQALNTATSYSNRANARLDHPARYVRESREAHRRCGDG